MHNVDRGVCLAGQLAQHGDDNLNGRVGVLVDLMNTYKWVNDDQPNVVGFDLVAHIGQQGFVLHDAVAVLNSQRDADVVFAVHEQLACDVFVLHVVMLHCGGEAQLQFAAGVFEVDDPCVSALLDRLAHKITSSCDGHRLNHCQRCLADAACGRCDADKAANVMVRVNPAPTRQVGFVNGSDRCWPCIT